VKASPELVEGRSLSRNKTFTPLEVCHYYLWQKSAKTLFCESKTDLIKSIMDYLLKSSQTSNGVLNVVIKFLSLGIEPRSKILTTLALS